MSPLHWDKENATPSIIKHKQTTNQNNENKLNEIHLKFSPQTVTLDNFDFSLSCQFVLSRRQHCVVTADSSTESCFLISLCKS